MVKAFNHIYAADLTTGTPAGTPAGARWYRRRRRGASATVTALLDAFGFDTSTPARSESWRIERDQPAYVQPFDANELREALGKAQRDING